jgi:hypothetical protein
MGEKQGPQCVLIEHAQGESNEIRNAHERALERGDGVTNSLLLLRLERSNRKCGRHERAASAALRVRIFGALI